MSENRLDQDFGFGSLLRFAAPSMVMMVFMSLYQMVDGVFVSRFVGEIALSSLNIVYPVLSVVIALSVMLATGGSAIIARTMGEGDVPRARGLFSLIIAVGAGLGAAFTLAGLFCLDPLVRALGAEGALYPDSYRYLLFLLPAAPLAVFQVLFQTFFITAGKPHLGLVLTILGGAANVGFDYWFIVLLDMGVAGAAIGTGLGCGIPGLFGLVYFAVCRRGTLYFVRPRGYRGFLTQVCVNGSSEMVSNLAVAVTTYLFNIQMLRYMGTDGVAAITIILYAQWMLTSVFFGFSGGVAPIISFHYGSGSRTTLRRVVHISVGFVLGLSAAVFAAALLWRVPIIGVFIPAGKPVFALAEHGFVCFSVSVLFSGLDIFASALFTAFSNGKVSALLSFLRTFLFLTAALILLPAAVGPEGLWWAIPAAEGLAFLLSAGFLWRYRKVYGYGG